eukprot:scaffold80927_cov42-Attheya_sp.AAC.6
MLFLTIYYAVDPRSCNVDIRILRSWFSFDLVRFSFRQVYANSKIANTYEGSGFDIMMVAKRSPMCKDIPNLT